MRPRLLLSMVCCWCALAGQIPQPPGSSAGSISGVALDGLTKTPIRRVVVTLSTVEARPQDAVAWTDANGRFAFGYLPAGRYQLRAQKSAYQLAAFGAETVGRPPAIIALDAGENRGDIVFRLQPLGAISGRVLDEDGDPISGAQVNVLSPGFARQKRTLRPGPGATTDSFGRFRLHHLAAGRYAVMVRPWFRQALQIQPEIAPGQSRRQYLYSVQYYPGADRAASAELLTVQPGKELEGVDFRLASRPAVALQGKLALPPGASPASPVQIMLYDGEPTRGANMGTSAGPPDFIFRLDNVPPGTYLAVAQASVQGKTYRGVQRVELGVQAVADLVLPLEAGVDLAGAVRVEGPDAAKYPAAYVTLVPGDSIPWPGPPLRAKVRPDGSFNFSGVVPGIWDIDAGPLAPTGYLKSMRLGDQDVLTEDMLISSSTTALLNIVLSTRAASLEGEVTGEGDQPARAVVLLAPDGKFRHVLSFYEFATSDEKGHFEFRRARPGSFRLYAFEELDASSIQDPEFLKPFETLGKPVELKEGQKVSTKLSWIPSARMGNP